jgi:hypothetical protein
MNAINIREKTINALEENEHILGIKKMIELVAEDGQHECSVRESDSALLDKVIWYFNAIGFVVISSTVDSIRIKW